MGDPLEVMTDGRLRTDPGDPPRRKDRVHDPGGTAASEGATETEAEAPGEEAKEEETAPDGELRADGEEIHPDGMVELKKDAEETDEPIRGRRPVDWALCSGPHWPLAGAVPIEESARLRRRTRWSMGTRLKRPLTPSAGRSQGQEHISVGLAGMTCIESETPTRHLGTDPSRDLMTLRSSARRTKD